MEDIQINLVKNRKPKQMDELRFGETFTDHMFVMDYSEQNGWHNPTILPYGPIDFLPCSIFLHYGQQVFEGLKAYKTVDGRVCLFRPQENFKRLNISCERLCIPKIDEDFALKALIKLLEIEREWVPSVAGASLYIRPFIIATDHILGVHPSKNYKFFIILSPSGSYYKNGLEPVKIYVESNYVRASVGGTGYCKTGGNYAASLKAQEEAEEKGYDQVLWLDGMEKRYIEEVGAMNVFFRFGETVVTPKLDGTILPGITRQTVLTLLRDWGIPIQERLLSIDELIKRYRNNKFNEAWGTGTAAVISPIGEFNYNGFQMHINHHKIGTLSKRLYDTLTGIQFGKLEDNYNWMVTIP